jgi:tetratricopeptide (TPR) repeat protein
MIRVESTVARFRRDMAVSSLLRGVLLIAAIFSVLMESTPLRRGPITGSLALAVIGGLWLLLSFRSVKGSRIASVSPALIASGNFEQAEQYIDQALRSFSLFRGVKLRSLHHLAILRHAQRRWGETAILCRTLLGQRLGVMSGLSRSTRLILADSLLQVGDVRGAYEAIIRLYQERLSLAEALEMTLVQLDYLARIGAWNEMMTGLGRKIELADLMSGQRSAEAQALLALAAHKLGRTEWEEWLRKRVELLADVNELAAAKPMLREVWPEAR